MPSPTPRYQELEREVHHLRHLLNIGEAPRQPSLHQHRPSSSQSQHRVSPGTSHNGSLVHQDLQASELIDDAAASEELTLHHLDAPITAVHAITSTGLPPSPSSIQSHRSSLPPASLLRHNQSTSASQRYDDVVSKGNILESEARKLFQLYMANANVFLPLFDPVVDTFDAIRQSSTFCFTVILAVALRAESTCANNHDKIRHCFNEAQKLASESLFTRSVRLETIQGMLLLAANSENNWFAISHAYQMSQDLGLPDLIHPEADHGGSEHINKDCNNRRQFRRMRAALTLHHVEQEVASGTARQSKCRPVHDDFLKAFLDNEFSTALDMRIVANVEIVRLRGRLLLQLNHHGSLVGSVDASIRNVDNEISTWFNRWDAMFQDQDYDIGCFQRSSIRLQRDYAFIIVCSAIMSKLGTELFSEANANVMTDEMRHVIRVTLDRSTKILQFIADNNDYKWHLQWAPTYSALFPVFTAALAFKLARMRPLETDWHELQSTFSAVAAILQDYPYRHFSLVIRKLSRLALEIGLSRRRPETGLPQEPQNNSSSRGGDPIRLGGTPTDPSLQNYRNEVADNSVSQDLISTYDVEVSGLSNAIDSAPEEVYSNAHERTWMPSDMSQYSFQDMNPGGEQLDIQSLLETPDYNFDFNLFATSIQSSNLN
ncbi:hypothetical protein NM208_g6628 [Fusarium decemcellulare]|uniref:Uncharacterized protein n=1 Tax=Fusarium decemcellulare TaxID=57161 RepID=A0ACC1SCP4_9HYPO|nr:hypothetical protein NM208_g6628 [Fusarium decemcellulare]